MATDRRSVHAAARPYRGIDRRPLFPGPDEDARLYGQGRASLLRLRERFWELEENGVLHRDPSVALRLSGELAGEGILVEVVRADVNAGSLEGVPRDLISRYRSSVDRWSVNPLPPEAPVISLGIDVTFPFPTFHSAIRQPVPLGSAAAAFDGLNAFGLFAEIEPANRLAAAGNSVETSWRPFCSVEVSLIGDDTVDENGALTISSIA